MSGSRWEAPDGLYYRYGAALHDADDHSCQLGEGTQYSVLLGAITRVRDEEIERLSAAVDRVRNLHRPVEHRGRTICVECSGWGNGSTDSPPTVHPCRTINALDS
ncbi:hypothetical protein [Streptomyces bacillaris]|uniref:hypothetical protein n=1 Tax=Streptomyces bacillaris TaxID=68179 RepID=UPI003EC0790A